MEIIQRYRFVLFLVFFLFSFGQPFTAYAQDGERTNVITEWQMRWEMPDEERTMEEMALVKDGWLQIRAGDDYPKVPDGIDTAWLKLKVPKLNQRRPAIVFEKLYAQDVIIYLDKKMIFERYRDYVYDRNHLLIPLSASESGKEIYIKLKNDYGRLGIQNEITVGDYDDLFKQDIKSNLLDVVLGSSLICIALFMLLSVMFLNRKFLPGWVSLFLVMLSIGVMILSYSSFMDKFFPEYGQLIYVLFDAASIVLLPSLFFFFEKIFGSGPYRIISRFKKIQIYLTIVSFILMSLSLVSDFINTIYFNYSTLYLGLSVLIGTIILIGSMIYYCLRGDKEAIIMAIGFGAFATVCVSEMILYFAKDTMHEFFLWKIAIIFFLASLIILLVRRIMWNYKQALLYSKQIEIFNNELQRSEKIETISNLAASIAHEVRNPLQVTRGFLQLLGDRMQEEKSKGYTLLAIEELDRASEIITDFLTFAKPDLGEVMQLDVAVEILQIEAILTPFATIQGGSIRVQTEKELLVKGNSSKFKQALINIIKNSIEAFQEEGIVTIVATKNRELSEITISIKDNGEGIEESDLKRLGEPYYSKKTKGTGLGLMVTYRIIEAMQGKITFSSIKGQGTEVCIRLPLIQ